MCDNKRFFICLLFFCLLFTHHAGAQDFLIAPQSRMLEESYPVKLYYDALGENAHLYNGYEYPTPNWIIKGSPYWVDSMTRSNLYYDECFYQNVPILYDMVLDLVVIDRLDQHFKISLISSKLLSFSLKNHEFVRINKDSLKGVDIPTGFYDWIYKGKSTILAKRIKTVQEVIEYNKANQYYIDNNLYFVKSGGRFVEVGNKTALLKLFASKKSEIKKYIRKNKLDFNSDFEKTLIAICAYYDQLTS